MNVQRHMHRVNAILLSILGENPLYQWIYSESTEFKRPMRVMDEDGNLQYDFVCPCGRNVSVHSVRCAAECLVVAAPVWMPRKIDMTLNDQWVLCCRQEQLSEAEWTQMFGTLLPYPRSGVWAPVQTETVTIAMPPNTLPGENYTTAVARGRQRSREIKASDIANAVESAEQKRDKARRTKIRERLTDCLPVRPTPGAVDGPVSLPSVVRQKIEQGESLVTL